MAIPDSRENLKQWCLRRLGDPVIEINVEESQMEDRIDEAIQYYQEFHSDAVFRTYTSHLMTADDITNKYISISSDTLYVTRMFPISSTFNATRGMFDIKYQMLLNDIATLSSHVGDLGYYEQMQQYLTTLDIKLNGYPQVVYARNQDRLYIHGDITDKDIVEGDYIVYEHYSLINPEDTGKVYNDMWLKEYTTALFKMQWGQNLIKFEGMQLPGGVTINGRQIYDDAMSDIERLRERIRLEFETPPDFMMG